MTYAAHRRIIDVDSHVIELEDFLYEAATSDERALLPSMSDQSELPLVQAGLERGRQLYEKPERPRHDGKVRSQFDERTRERLEPTRRLRSNGAVARPRPHGIHAAVDIANFLFSPNRAR